MHAIEITHSKLSNLPVTEWWTTEATDLEKIAEILLGPLPGGWVRKGDNFIRVGSVKYGANARKLNAELTTLSAETKRVFGAGDSGSILRAAAFYHLRFENIHPLCEANGRVGRVVLACQLQQSLLFPIAETLAGLKDWEVDYSNLFATNNSELMFELLLDLLTRIVGISLSTEAAKLPASIEPLHLQKGGPVNAARLHPEKGMSNPDLVKKFAQQNRPPQRNNYFRKFG